MGIIQEFREVQQDVNELKLRDARNEETSRGVVNNTTAGLFKSTANGYANFTCTQYSRLQDMLKAYATNTIKLTAGTGSPAYPVKSGINKIPLQAFVVECAGVYSQPWLDENLRWIPVQAQTTPAYYALARVGSSEAIVCQFPASGGGGDFDKGQITYVSNVMVTQPDQYTLQIDVTKLTAQVAVW